MNHVLAELTHDAVRSAPWQAAVLPFGATEPHNLHMPYGTDTLQVDELARRACALAGAKGARVIQLPAVPFGVNTNYLRSPGGLLPMSLPYDHVFDQGWHFGLKVRLVTPTPCGHDEQIASTIVAPPSAARKFHWARRLPAFAWRLRNELRRLVYGLQHSLRERLNSGA